MTAMRATLLPVLASSTTSTTYPCSASSRSMYRSSCMASAKTRWMTLWRCSGACRDRISRARSWPATLWSGANLSSRRGRSCAHAGRICSNRHTLAARRVSSHAGHLRRRGVERAPRLEGSGYGVELREVATPPMAGTGTSSWCADDLVRIPGLGPRCGVEGMRTGASAHHSRRDADGGVRAPQSKGMRTGASAHHSRRGCGRGRPRTTVAPPSDRARSVGERRPAPSLRDAPHGACRPGPARSRPAALPRRPRRKTATPTTPGSRATGR